MRNMVLVAAVIPLFGCTSSSRYITEKDFSPYPFTVEGYLECERPGAIVFKANGNIYGVNGTAQDKYRSIAKPLEEIWKSDPNILGARINVSDVISAGQKLCQ